MHVSSNAGTVEDAHDVLRWHDVREYGAILDGTGDNLSAFQAALDAAAASATPARVGRVGVPPGLYNFTSSVTLNIPWYVSLESWGTPWPQWQTNDQNGGAGIPYSDPSTANVPKGAACLMFRNSTGGAAGTPAITMARSSALRGFLFYDPDQPLRDSQAVVPKPWTVDCVGDDCQVERCHFFNVYQGIKATDSQRQRLFHLSGQPLYRCVQVELSADVTRWFNHHWWPFHSRPGDALLTWIKANGECFRVGRADAISGSQLFCYGYAVGMRLYTEAAGSPIGYGHFGDFETDACGTGIVVDSCGGTGYVFTGGGHVAGGNNCVKINATNVGRVRFLGTHFKAALNQAIVHDGGDLDLVGCQFHFWGTNGGTGGTIEAIDLNAGSATVSGNRFSSDDNTLNPSGSVKCLNTAAGTKGVATGNVARAGWNVTDNSGGTFLIPAGTNS